MIGSFIILGCAILGCVLGTWIQNSYSDYFVIRCAPFCGTLIAIFISVLGCIFYDENHIETTTIEAKAYEISEDTLRFNDKDGNVKFIQIDSSTDIKIIETEGEKISIEISETILLEITKKIVIYD